MGSPMTLKYEIYPLITKRLFDDVEFEYNLDIYLNDNTKVIINIKDYEEYTKVFNKPEFDDHETFKDRLMVIQL